MKRSARARERERMCAREKRTNGGSTSTNEHVSRSLKENKIEFFFIYKYHIMVQTEKEIKMQHKLKFFSESNI